jgi:1,4-dihydroxy-2-naphthoate octaprenyltransferase
VSAPAWVIGARLRTLPAAVAPVLMGGGLAAHAGGFVALPFVAALFAAILIQVGTNYANDYSDHVRGADNESRMGTIRIAQSGLMSPERVRAAAAVSFGLATAIGLYLVYRGGWPILAIGIASIVAGICYTGGPWPFGYNGLGDLFVFVFFGPVAVAGTVYVQTLTWGLGPVWAGAGVGALITAILVVNNLRDIPTDAEAGKRTLAVLIGEKATKREYLLLLLVACAVPCLGAGFLGWPLPVTLALIPALLAPGPIQTVLRFEDRRELNAALPATARLAGLYGVFFAVGCLL